MDAAKGGLLAIITARRVLMTTTSPVTDEVNSLTNKVDGASFSVGDLKSPLSAFLVFFSPGSLPK